MVNNERIVDTFPSFLKAIEARPPETLDDWLALWREQYMIHWPELFAMQVADYKQQGEDWQQVAREMVLPGMSDKVPTMKRVYQDLSRIIEPIEAMARHSLGFTGDVIYVLYVGIGNGAGWVTTYAGRPAVLFGLEGIVDSGFIALKKLEGLVAHELGHVTHFSWRAECKMDLGIGAWWQLYEEGFAQYCEQRILGSDSWHMNAASQGEDWLAWCRENRAWLAAEFLRVAEVGESVRPFFGSWYDVRGHKQTGYYLGHEVVARLAGNMTLNEIALLDEGEVLARTMRRVLGEIAVGPSLG